MKNVVKFLFIALLLSGHYAMGQWTAVSINPAKYVTTLNFLNDDLGYAMMIKTTNNERTLEKTTDGGDTWTALTLPLQGNEFQDMDFHADGVGVAVFRDVGNPVTPTMIFKTTNDGLVWTDITPDTTAIGMGTSVCQFLSPDSGYFATDNTIYKTVDGGATWTKTVLAGYPMSIDFLDADHGTIGLFDGTFNYFGGMATTIDGGATWTTTWLTGTGTVIGEVGQLTPSVSYAAPVKFGAYNQHKFFRTSDNGATWDTIFVPDTLPDASLSDLYFKDLNHGVAIMSSFTSTNVYETTDGGATWALQDTLPWFTVTDLELTAHTGFISGDIGNVFRLSSALSVQPSDLGDLNIYPSPATAGQEIRWNSAAQWTKATVMDMTGKIVAQQELTHAAFELPNIVPGIYLLRLENADLQGSAKLMVR